jgi:hypothetical protein
VLSLCHGRAKLAKPITAPEFRFWGRVQKSPNCWLWTGDTKSHGYGRMVGRNRKLQHVHRVSWELHFGPIPVGLFVLHKCDVKACVRPDHLFLGTQEDNIRDCVNKGRHVSGLPPVPTGETCPSAKLKDREVVEIRRLYSTGLHTNESIARLFHISHQHVSRVIRREQRP